MRKVIVRYVFLLFAVLLCAIVLVSLVREFGRDYFVSENTYSPERRDRAVNAARWLDAVKAGNEGKAVAAAKALIPSSDSPELPDLSSLKAVRVFGLKTTGLTDDFGRNDFLYWRDCFEMMLLAQKLKNEKRAAPEDIFEFVRKHVSDETAPEPGTAFCAGLLRLKKLKESDKIRLACAIARQLGYGIMLAAIPGKDGKFFYLCELRDGKNTATADFGNGAFYRKSIQELLLSPPPALKDSFAPDKTIFIQPSEFFDFRLANRKLARALAASGIGNVPVFGVDPEEAIKSYARKYFDGRQDIKFNHWDVPFLAAKKLMPEQSEIQPAEVL